MASELISICIPTYNMKLDFLREAVQSALSQSYSPIEIVISENHSDNDAGEMLAAYTDPRIRIVTPPRHLPMTENFWFSFEQSRGAMVCFLPSDDRLEPHFCSILARALKSDSDLTFVHCGSYTIDDRSRTVEGSHSEGREGVEILEGREEIRWYLNGPRHNFVTSLYPRNTIETIGPFRPGLDFVGDWDFEFHLIPLGRYGRIHRALVGYRSWHSKSRADRLPAQIRQIRQMYAYHGSQGAFQNLDWRLLEAARERWAKALAIEVARSSLRANQRSEAFAELAELSDTRMARYYRLLCQRGKEQWLLRWRHLRILLGRWRRHVIADRDGR